jgi:hypothetical protein
MLARATLDVARSDPSPSCIEHIPPSAFTRIVVYATVEIADSVSRDVAVSADNFLQELVTKVRRSQLDSMADQPNSRRIWLSSRRCDLHSRRCDLNSRRSDLNSGRL